MASASDQNIQVVYWNTDNSSCNGIFEITNSTYASNFTINITEVTEGAVYKLHAVNDTTVIASGAIVDGVASIQANGLVDGKYRIVETGIEKIIIESWTPDSENRIGVINITDSTKLSVWKFIIHNAKSGHTYKLIDSNNEEITEAITIRGDATLTTTGLQDGVYYIHLENAGYQSYVKPALISGSLITTSYVLASTFNRRRKHE